jgi:hypothetical protein
MTAKPPFDRFPSIFRARSPRRGRRAGIAAIATVVALALGATQSLADTGSVYFDANHNVGAGHDFFDALDTGGANVGIGYSVMPNLTTGGANVGIGYNALNSDTTGSANVASGYNALNSDTTGSANVASGLLALSSNTTGNFNVASGSNALIDNATGSANVASGFQALNHNTTGVGNIALGHLAGQNLTTGDDNIDIANDGVGGESGTIRIGTGAQTAAYLAGVWGTSISGRTKSVIVNSDGQLGTAKARSTAAASSVKRLRAEVKRQQRELRQQHAAIEQLRKQMRKGG